MLLLIFLGFFHAEGQAANSKLMTYTSQNVTERMLLSIDEEFYDDDVLMCGRRCVEINKTCYSFTFDNGTRRCHLGSWMVPLNNTAPPPNVLLYSTGNFCNTTENVTLLSSGEIKSCDLAFCAGSNVNIGTNSTFDPKAKPRYKTCRDVISGNSRQVVKLTSGLVVMCDTDTVGGGWTVFQRRVTGAIDFYRDWESYKRGFGDYGVGEFYLGNEFVYCMTSQAAYELRIDIVYNGVAYYEVYSNFSLTSESDFYRLKYNSSNGTAGDSLTYRSKNFQFSTFDQDHDTNSTGSCAFAYRGAWWYSNCHRAHLNGNWGSDVYGYGLTWHDLTGFTKSVDKSEMKIRVME